MRVVVELLAVHKVAPYQRAATLAAVEGSRPPHDKGKRKIADSTEAKQSCKFKADPLVLKATLDIEEKK